MIKHDDEQYKQNIRGDKRRNAVIGLCETIRLDQTHAVLSLAAARRLQVREHKKGDKTSKSDGIQLDSERIGIREASLDLSESFLGRGIRRRWRASPGRL